VLSAASTYLERLLTLNALITPMATELVTLKMSQHCIKATYSSRMKSLRARPTARGSIGLAAQLWEARGTKTKSKASVVLRWPSRSPKRMKFYFRTLNYSLWCVKYTRKAWTLSLRMTWSKPSRSTTHKTVDTTPRRTSSTQSLGSLNRSSQLT